jgi:predicted acylesterase/phospholipase RssA
MTEKQIVGGKRSIRPEKQRALVLQGGGALGAYEVGAIKGLYETLTQEQAKNDSCKDSKAPLFDIIAGSWEKLFQSINIYLGKYLLKLVFHLFTQ